MPHRGSGLRVEGRWAQSEEWRAGPSRGGDAQLGPGPVGALGGSGELGGSRLES